MLGIDSRAVRVAWSVFLFALVLALLYLMLKTVLIFILAILFAYLLSTPVDYLQRFLLRFLRRPSSRILSLALVYVVLVGILVGGGILIGNKVAEQTTQLAENIKTLPEDLQKRLEKLGPPWSELSSRVEQIANMAPPVLKEIGAKTLDLMSNLVLVVLVPILGFFFLKDGANLKRAWVDELVSTEKRPIVESILDDVHVVLGQFMRALVILSLATFTVYSIFLSIVGMPYALVLALTAALLEFIPVIGTFSAAALIVLVALFSHHHALLVVIFMVAYRLFQDYVLSPQLMSHGVELHPLAVIFGVLAGEQVAGVAGMFLSIPVIAILRVVYLRMQRARLTAPQPLAAP